MFRRRNRANGNGAGPPVRIPGHPLTTIFFILACCVITFSVIYKEPRNSAISFGIMLASVPVYFIWARLAKTKNRDGTTPESTQ